MNEPLRLKNYSERFARICAGNLPVIFIGKAGSGDVELVRPFRAYPT